jgi:hypothetical protein
VEQRVFWIERLINDEDLKMRRVAKKSVDTQRAGTRGTNKHEAGNEALRVALVIGIKEEYLHPGAR